MNYRPEGWKAKSIAHNTMSQNGVNFPYENDLAICVQCVEAGADAILEGLRKVGTPTGFKYTAYENERKGTLVFIPDGDSKDGN